MAVARITPIPPLQPGDHLDAKEFERRYDATPNLKKAELLEGVVYMPPCITGGPQWSSVFDQVVNWFVLRGGNYEQLVPAPDGVLRSEVLPGLWLNSPALLKGDLAAALHTLQQGMSSPEHARFTERLRQASASEV